MIQIIHRVVYFNKNIDEYDHSPNIKTFYGTKQECNWFIDENKDHIIVVLQTIKVLDN